MRKECCLTCKYWDQTEEYSAVYRHGDCQRYPPSVKVEAGEEEELTFWVHITTLEQWWCGEYKPVTE